MRYTKRQERNRIEEGKRTLSGSPWHRSYILKGTASCGGCTLEQGHCWMDCGLQVSHARPSIHTPEGTVTCGQPILG